MLCSFFVFILFPPSLLGRIPTTLLMLLRSLSCFPYLGSFLTASYSVYCALFALDSFTQSIIAPSLFSSICLHRLLSLLLFFVLQTHHHHHFCFPCLFFRIENGVAASFQLQFSFWLVSNPTIVTGIQLLLFHHLLRNCHSEESSFIRSSDYLIMPTRTGLKIIIIKLIKVYSFVFDHHRSHGGPADGRCFPLSTLKLLIVFMCLFDQACIKSFVCATSLASTILHFISLLRALPPFKRLM